MTTKKKLGTVCFYVIAILLAVIAMIPFLWMISTSFKSRGALMSIPIQWIPEEPTLAAYIKVFSKFPFAKTIGNSLFISVSYTIITLLSSSMAAFAFAKLQFPGNSLLLRCYLATMMIPTQVTMIPLFVVMNRMGLIDSYASVILPSIFRPFAVFCWYSRCARSPTIFWMPQGLTEPMYFRYSARLRCRYAFQAWLRCRLRHSWNPGTIICGRC